MSNKPKTREEWGKAHARIYRTDSSDEIFFELNPYIYPPDLYKQYSTFPKETAEIAEIIENKEQKPMSSLETMYAKLRKDGVIK